ncbi:MAG: dipeptide ABC transporter ATP-binding protein [Nitrospinaceae bacterium]
MLLEVDNLRTYFRVGLTQVAQAVDGISFQLDQGKTLALVGESGCGKSQTAFSIIRLIAENGYHPSGKILFDRENLSEKSEADMRRIRGNDIAMIFQEPMTSLNPLYRIGNQLEEPLRMHRMLQKGPARKRAIELLDHVGLPDPDKRIDDYPHQLSGGMKQRVMIAMALACEPKLLIADEPTTALDVTIQAQVLRLMADLQKETGMAILLITHDMGIVNQMADDVSIMYAGRIVEQGSREQIFGNMMHPYTRRLFESIPKPGDEGYQLNTIPGLVPPATDYGEGCLFADRCAYTMDVCRSHDSKIYKVERGHTVRCHLFEGGITQTAAQEEPKIPAPKKSMGREPLITVEGLKTWFPVRKGVFRRIANYVKAVDHVDLKLMKGSTVALVGESGCGKTTLGESILRLNREVQGTVRFQETDVMSLPMNELKQIRRHMQIVFQDPFGSLSPRLRVREIIGEGLQVHFSELGSDETNDKISKVLREVGMDPSVADRYPHEFSGGQRQRISIARALILEPEFLVLDEPTSALDVSVQAQVLNLLRELQAKRNLTYLFITHNLNVVQYISDEVAIMYLGRIVEYAAAKELFQQPKHPYTQTLLKAVPSLGERKPFEPVVGDVPSPLNPPSGCHFHPRCPILMKEPEGSPLHQKCRNEYPEKKFKGNTFVACHAVD